MKNDTNSKLFVTVRFESHEQAFTVTRVGQLTELLSRPENRKPFTFGDMVGTYPTKVEGDLTAFVRELNAIKRFGHYAGKPATAA